MIKRLSLKLFAVILVLSAVVAFPARVYAYECNPPKAIFDKIADTLESYDIRRTATNITASFVTDFLIQGTTGVTYDQMMGCMNYLKAHSDALNGIEIDCDGTPDATCESFFNLYADVNVPGASSLQFAQGQTAGSLLGIAYYIDGVNTKEPLPVNLAYYATDYASKLPFMDRALAQTNYNQPFLGEILDAWKLFRNVAYGLVAILLIVVGFMIMTRKKLNQQVVVNVQYALPKVAVALILITFSYPIGATMMTVSRVLQLSMPTILSSLGGVALIPAGASIGALVLLLLAYIFGFAGVGLVLGFIVVALIAAIFILWIVVQVKILMAYLKMLFSVIFAPIEFAIGAVPGADDKTIGWFKRMAANGLSIIAMGAAVNLVMIIGQKILLVQLSGAEGAGSWVGGALITVFGTPFIILFGLFFALQLPAKIEAAIMGAPKRK